MICAFGLKLTLYLWEITKLQPFAYFSYSLTIFKNFTCLGEREKDVEDKGLKHSILYLRKQLLLLCLPNQTTWQWIGLI